jgi:hypothetical protein
MIMAVKRRGGAVALVLALGLGAGTSACKEPQSGIPTAPSPPNRDAAVFQACTSVCIRPGDCAHAFNDDGICPPGFLCALRFQCSTD